MTDEDRVEKVLVEVGICTIITLFLVVLSFIGWLISIPIGRANAAYEITLKNEKNIEIIANDLDMAVSRLDGMVYDTGDDYILRLEDSVIEW